MTAILLVFLAIRSTNSAPIPPAPTLHQLSVSLYPYAGVRDVPPVMTTTS